MFAQIQTPAICKEAIKQNWKMMQYVKDQTKELCDYALQVSPLAAMYIRREVLEEHYTEDTSVEAVLQNNMENVLRKNTRLHELVNSLRTGNRQLTKEVKSLKARLGEES